MDLEAIPGVGPKTAGRLRALEDPVDALEDGDVATLARAPGIGPAQAARITRAAIRDRHDDPGGFLGTDHAEAIYEDLLEILRGYTVTDYAAFRLATFYPSGVDARIAEARTVARRALDRDPDPAIREAMADLEPLNAPEQVRVRDRCVATADAETYERARRALPELSVELVDGIRSVTDLASGYATVVVLDETFAGHTFDGDVRVDPTALDSPESLVPERTLSYFATNEAAIRAAIAVHRAADLDLPEGLAPATVLGALDQLGPDGEPRGDDEYDRLEAAVSDIDAAVSTAESVANDRLREAIRERNVTIEGADLLSLVERGAGADAVFSRELADEHETAIAGARDHLVDALELRDTADLATAVFDDNPTYPVSRNERAVADLRQALEAARDRRAEALKTELADSLADAKGPCEVAVDRALELDLELAIARFAATFGCTIPERKGRGFEIEGGRSPLLDEPVADIDPVDYDVPDIALLSGVNSGGKTATLDLVAAVTILGHMGLPVPAEHARIPATDELHYHAKSQGTLDAGAFEPTLRDFADIASGEDNARKLILVDELESITEPGASAVIVAGVLEALAEAEATALVVSHLAGEIKEVCAFDVRIDGIRALGLEDGRLKVDRSPIPGHLARSTPELIVEQLASETGAPFYDRLLAKFAAADRE